MKKLLVISVGGSPEPVIASIDCQRPDLVAYLVSRGTRKVVRELVETAIAHRPSDHEIIVTPDEQDMVATVEALQSGLTRLLEQWGECEIVGDFTGGTKAMSAALVLALAHRNARFSYMGGAERTKGGLGVVVDGHEQMLYLANPWDVLAIGCLREMELLFNRCRFRSVIDLADHVAQRAGRSQSFFQALRHVAEGYYAWDNFDYRRALALLRQGGGMLRPFAEGSANPRVKGFAADVDASIESLTKVEEDTLVFKSKISPRDVERARSADGEAVIRDLVANAMRRAEIEFKYEDAVARLYSAVEKTAKVRLKMKYGIDNSAVDPGSVPIENLRREWLERFGGRNGLLQLPLGRSYELLDALGDPLGERYRACQADLDKVLSVRNLSLLAHGFEPVGEQTYLKLLAIALDFLQIGRADLPVFPCMEWGGEGL